MLTLSVREGDYVTIRDDIVVQVVKTGDVFRIAIDALRSMQIARSTNRGLEDAVPPCIAKLQQQEPPGYKVRRRLSSRSRAKNDSLSGN